MSILERYQGYAAAFEQTYEDDDWSRIEPFFAEGAVYEGDPTAHGRAAVLDKLKGGIDSFDRLMDERLPEFQPPTVDGNTLTMTGKVTYKKAGAPNLVLSGVETAQFEGDQIASLRDDMDPGVEKGIGDWMAAHGAKLQGA